MSTTSSRVRIETTTGKKTTSPTVDGLGMPASLFGGIRRRLGVERATVTSLVVGSALAVVVWVVTLRFNRQLPSALPHTRSGLLVFVVVPVTVGLLYERYGSLRATFLAGFLPVYTIYYIQHFVYQWGVIVDFGLFSALSPTLLFSLLYWIIGVGGAVLVDALRRTG